MTNQISITVDTTVKKQPLGDMFGIFFEDLNHAADGGLYAEMIRNRSFEFCEIDNKSYDHLTAWKLNGLQEMDDKNSKKQSDLYKEDNIGKNYGTFRVEKGVPVSDKNPHYLTINIIEPEAEDAYLVNEGWGTGLYLKEGKNYNYSMFCRSYGHDIKVKVSLTDEDGSVFASQTVLVEGDGWRKYKCVFTPSSTTVKGRLKLQFPSAGRVSLDHISMFPEDTFLKKENGLRDDIAQLLKALKPRFMRFPGGCLVHDGSLNANDRDSMYRWKNTLGDVIQRPARKSNWGYNQTLGLGYYEYFCFSEEIGAKPLPVLPGGYNPHRQISIPLSEIEAWVEEALDLIEFANGGTYTKWGKIRAELGHEEPFGLEYIAIGNEEVGEAFFDRYPFFQKAINERYPHIKVIGTSGPFAAGGEFDRGWNSARENGADLVDEHYYMSPEWFLANIDRYAEYKEEDPKVFLGEYATWGNTYYNALVEAAYMTRLQENAHAVGLACYAPLLCNADYVNWKPDMIWFNNHQVYATPNYYVQKMFMHHQGDYLLNTSVENVGRPRVVQPVDFSGAIELEVSKSSATYSNIEVINDVTKEVYHFGDRSLTSEDNSCKLMDIKGSNYTIKLNAKQDDGKRGFIIGFGKKDDDNKYYWELGGWQNLDSDVQQKISGRGSCLTQYEFSVDYDHTYELKITVTDEGNISCYVDGKLFMATKVKPAVIEDIYVTSSLEEASGDIIVKAVNIDENEKPAKIQLAGSENKDYKVIVEEMKNFQLDGENSFDEPDKICSKVRETEVHSDSFEYIFPANSVTVLRVKGAGRN